MMVTQNIPAGSQTPWTLDWDASIGLTSALGVSLSLLPLGLKHIRHQVGDGGVVLPAQEVLGLDQALHQAGLEAHAQHRLHHGGQHGGGTPQTGHHV